MLAGQKNDDENDNDEKVPLYNEYHVTFQVLLVMILITSVRLDLGFSNPQPYSLAVYHMIFAKIKKPKQHTFTNSFYHYPDSNDMMEIKRSQQT